MANIEMNVLKVGSSEFEIADAKARQDCSDLKEDFYDSLVTDTASGSIASFPDGADNVPVKSLKVNIEPVQEGSGDPSPTNIRPISGRTQAIVTRAGVNVWDEEWELGRYDTTTGNAFGDTTRIRCKNPIPVTGGTSYYITKPATYLCYDADGNYTNQYTYLSDGGRFTIGENVRYIKFYATTAYGTTYNHDISINYPSTDHDYHEGHVQTVTIELNGTIYGGTLNATTGVLTVDRAGAVLNDPDKWVVSPGTTTTYQYDVVFANRKFYADSFTGLSCSMMPVNSHTVRYTARWIGASDGTFGIAFNGENPELTLAQIKALASNGDISIAYDIEPQTVQLTAQEVRTLLGQNNVFADCGDTTVEYRADTKLYIQKVLNA